MLLKEDARREAGHRSIYHGSRLRTCVRCSAQSLWPGTTGSPHSTDSLNDRDVDRGHSHPPIGAIADTPLFSRSAIAWRSSRSRKRSVLTDCLTFSRPPVGNLRVLCRRRTMGPFVVPKKSAIAFSLWPSCHSSMRYRSCSSRVSSFHIFRYISFSAFSMRDTRRNGRNKSTNWLHYATIIVSAQLPFLL